MSSLEPQNVTSKTTTDEDLLSRLRYTRSRLEDSEISTDAVEQIDDELEATTASLNKKLQVSIGSATGSGLDSDQHNPQIPSLDWSYLLNLNKILKAYLDKR